MAPKGATVESDVPTIYDSAPDTSLSTPPIPTPAQAKSTGPEPTKALAEDDQTHTPSPGIADELYALKLKILELESKTQAAPGPSQLTAEQEEYLRMEKCLYEHRKEWEQTAGTENYQVWVGGRRTAWKEGPSKSGTLGPGPALMPDPTVLLRAMPPEMMPPGIAPLPPAPANPTNIQIHTTLYTNTARVTSSNKATVSQTTVIVLSTTAVAATASARPLIYLAEAVQKRKLDAREQHGKKEAKKNDGYASGDENPEENVIVKHAKPTLNRTN
ncbi:hypothetical protein QQZ08_009390 [Neonectria magnoliae]|uniref:Uncharacterized protein n=1 Tax=Neonectria magnoliae TaxID=2732573 RepID=A0ABR1HPF1_9HYPO